MYEMNAASIHHLTTCAASFSRIFERMDQNLHAGAHILPSSLFFADPNPCMGSDVRNFQALFCAYAMFMNEAPGPLLPDFFRFMMCQMFSAAERSGLQSDQFSSWTLLMQSHPVVMDAACGPALSC